MAAPRTPSRPAAVAAAKVPVASKGAKATKAVAPPVATVPAPAPRENRRLVLVASVVAAVIALPVGISVGMAWVEMPWSASQTQPAPEWVSVPTLRATTSDGSSVKARVALDVDGSAAKSAIQRNVQQVGLLLEVTVASHSRRQLGAEGGLGRLSDDMRGRLNDYLGSDGKDVVKSVAIQDLIVNPQ